MHGARSRRAGLFHVMALLLATGCGGSSSGGTGGSGGASGSGGAAGSGGAQGAGGAGGNGGANGGGGAGAGGACAESTRPAGFCCFPAQDPLIGDYICDASTGTWACPPQEIRAMYQSDCLRPLTGGTFGSGGLAAGGHGGAGGAAGGGGGGGSSGCPTTQPSSVCCLALVDHDPLTEPFVCAGTGTWVCPTGTIPEPSISGCLTSGRGGASGSGGHGGF